MRDSNDIYIIYFTINTSRRYLVLTQNIGRFADTASTHIVEVDEADGTMEHIAKVNDAVEKVVDEASMAPTFK